ncbi:hypothetical protein M407DRAFT_242295 [Tulasnella calospora MUT 4182]|uniref:Uncharacterized protein n=1 Tax=Tulasnella calospora MUT 4182 TaxID=1051891 RepID=A0A0C3L8W0_9AGAM|nr:hypothetical protein M407DRAFT_242295 [Tulasnella calospora MUT 4182]
MQLEGSNSSDDGRGISNAAQWVGSSLGQGPGYLSQYLAPPGMNNYGVSGPQFGDADDFDETVDPTEFGLKGWSPEQK